jgi:hypothetical protein
MASNYEQYSAEALMNSVGALGSKEITGTSAVTPPTGYYFYAIDIVADTVFSAENSLLDNSADLTAFTVFAAGSTIYGKWDSITLTSGEAIGYLARD